MSQPNIETYQPKIKAAHRYEVVSSTATPSLTGKKFHFIGVGGVGMSALAKLLIKNKAVISGSDQAQTPPITGLRKIGADIKIGHDCGNLNPQTDAVVISAAIKEDNPELKLARKKGCEIYKYAQMLGTLCNQYDGIAVAGTHGKSTTAGWLVHLLKQAGVDPNFIIGANISQLDTSSGVADSKYFVAEACEYDRSFLNLKPAIACILNVEADHLDYYKDEEEIVDAFRQFALGIKPGGILIANGTDPNATKVIKALPAHLNCQTFGINKSCNFSAQNIRLKNGLYAFDVYHEGKLMGKTQISLPGRHNILNALAVVAMATSIGLDTQQVLELLTDYTGIERRLMLKAQIDGITVLDDYAHHPTEIRATLAAIRQRYLPNRILCVFQPHQHSRTRFFLDDFAESFKLADVTIVPEIYFVRDAEAEKKEINSQILVKKMRANDTEAVFMDGFETIGDYLKKNVTSGDLVVTMGAGD
ncbi:MAG: UDP-N-acetylmuramate--L-alanine ligase, partial [Planctomycetes bacterium]|nr:UDP-N-acetylmuramate--L-alanine ligase [Planctomycetota bacterium]